MIINFKFKNFKNFKNEVSFSFEKGLKRELEEHIYNLNDDYKLVPIKVIYGSNSAGKTNFFRAIAMLKKIIKNGIIRESKDDYIGLCSNFCSLNDYESPISFSIKFSIKEDIYEYKLDLKNNFNLRTSEVLFESLTENNEKIFERVKQSLSFSNNKKIVQKYYEFFSDEEYLVKLKTMLESNLNDVEIFTKWFNNINNDLCQKIIKYFTEEIITIIDLEKFKVNIPDTIIKDGKDKIITNDYIENLLKELNVGNQKLFFEVDSEENVKEKVLYTENDFKISTYASATESKGTLKMVDLIDPILTTLDRGYSLFIDEFDASIHHEVIYAIIQAFGDKNINKNGAQLIFSTHNPVYMNKDLLRRDEIMFVEKNENEACICSLDDYNLRNDEVYLKNYLAGHYTILPEFDLKQIIDN